MDAYYDLNDVDAILPDDFDVNNPNYSLDSTPEEAPTTETESETNAQEVVQESETTEPTTPQVETEQPAIPQTVKVKFNHEERELSLDEAATYAQKGMNYDKLNERVQGFEAANARNERLAKRLGYENAGEMIDAAEKNYYNRQVRELIDAGNTEAMARFLVDQQMKEEGLAKEQPQAQAPVQESSAPKINPDRKAELDEFIAAFPGVTILPPEVITANRSGVRLKDAYSNYMSKQAQIQNQTVTPQVSAPQAPAQPQLSEVEKLRQENQILKQNQASAAMAPVTGVTGRPSTDTVDPLENDPFMKGFNYDQW